MIMMPPPTRYPMVRPARSVPGRAGAGGRDCEGPGACLPRALRAIPPLEYANREEVARSLPENPVADRGLSAAQRAEQARERNRMRRLSQLDREVPKPVMEEELER
jgi:hypothetical protein